MTIELGDTAEDIITGFSGVVTSRHVYLNGCVRLSLQSPTLKDGKVLEPETFDIQQLRLVEKEKAMSAGPEQEEPPGGPARAMPAPRTAPAR